MSGLEPKLFFQMLTLLGSVYVSWMARCPSPRESGVTRLPPDRPCTWMSPAAPHAAHARAGGHAQISPSHPIPHNQLDASNAASARLHSILSVMLR